FLEQAALEGGAELRVPVHHRRGFAPVEAEGRERAGRLADVPLDGVQAEAAVGDVGRADVLGRRNQVADADRDERAERDLKRTGAAAYADVLGSGAVNVDRVPAHP